MNVYLKLFLLIVSMILFLVSVYFSIKEVLFREHICDGFDCVYLDLSNTKSLSLDGNTLVVGTYDYYGRIDTEAVYIFEKENNLWTKRIKISDNDQSGGFCRKGDTEFKCFDIDLDSHDYFGSSVAIDENTLVVGAFGDDDGGYNSNRGAVYIFEKSGGTWTKTLKISDNGGGEGLLDIDLDNGDNFGGSVLIDGNTLVVGVSGDDDGGIIRGAVYIFEKQDGIWNKKYKISNNKNNQDFCKEFTCINVNLNESDGFGSKIEVDDKKLFVVTDVTNKRIFKKNEIHIFEKQLDTYKWIEKRKILEKDIIGSSCMETKCKFDLNLSTQLYPFDSNNFSSQENSLAVFRSSILRCYNENSVYIFKRKSKDSRWIKESKIFSRLSPFPANFPFVCSFFQRLRGMFPLFNRVLKNQLLCTIFNICQKF